MDTNLRGTSRANYVRPDRFVEGGIYIWIEPHPCKQHEIHEAVRFIGYAPCPATVIVLDRKNNRTMVSRDQLYLKKNSRKQV